MSAGFSRLEHGRLLLRHFALCMAADSPPSYKGSKTELHNSLRDIKQSTPKRALALVPCLGFSGPQSRCLGWKWKHPQAYLPPFPLQAVLQHVPLFACQLLQGSSVTYMSGLGRFPVQVMPHVLQSSKMFIAFRGKVTLHHETWL